jgi:DNA-binding PadR family transcriptional regulator
MQDVAEFHGSRMEPGTLYGALDRLERRGWIAPMPAEERRRPYRLTAVGAETLQRHLRSMQRVVVTGLERLPQGSGG